MKQIEAFEQYAKTVVGKKTLTAKEINAGAAIFLGRKPTMCASDFAKNETNELRSKKNPELFVRKTRGVYIVKGK